MTLFKYHARTFDSFVIQKGKISLIFQSIGQTFIYETCNQNELLVLFQQNSNFYSVCLGFIWCANCEKSKYLYLNYLSKDSKQLGELGNKSVIKQSNSWKCTFNL